ncbi:hypothetical protein GCM10009678_47430 [Actinomadura kijaniata]|uniref:Uncharacterized protein n=1 Tax=Actinomadura namibiensis TaxID=182080 RepID=A0A7W3QK08_ACTNM|nr:hypothetical protein [Actinomadura namibiensis]MBA8949945.1 hypothetical protein [Actinomadura namibiensis]
MPRRKQHAESGPLELTPRLVSEAINKRQARPERPSALAYQSLIPASYQSLDIDPTMEQLVRRLPPPGGSMSSVDAERWLDTARSVIGLVYVDPAEG